MGFNSVFKGLKKMKFQIAFIVNLCIYEASHSRRILQLQFTILPATNTFLTHTENTFTIQET